MADRKRSDGIVRNDTKKTVGSGGRAGGTPGGSVINSQADHPVLVRAADVIEIKFGSHSIDISAGKIHQDVVGLNPIANRIADIVVDEQSAR